MLQAENKYHDKIVPKDKNVLILIDICPNTPSITG